jgi:hypothetical protein
MIAASWPMPKSYIAPVQETSEQDSRIKSAIDDFQKKGKLKNSNGNNLSESEINFLQECLSQAMNELAAKVLLKAVNETIAHELQTHDLDDVYDPKDQSDV